MKREERDARIDANLKAVDEVYKIAQERANVQIAELKGEIQEIKVDSFAVGFLAANKVHRAACDFTDALMLYRVKKTKDYKKTSRTWEQFCEDAGYEVRTADRILAEIAPVIENFSGQLSIFTGIGLSEIRYLGKSFGQLSEMAVSDDGASLIIGDETIPATPADVLAYIKNQKEKHKTETEAKDKDLAAKDKVLADKEKLINKYAKDLAKLEGKAKEKNLTPEEEGFLKKVEGLRLGFDGYMLRLEPDRMEELSFDVDPAPTPRMRAAYLAALDYMKKQLLVAFERATDMYGNAIMCPEAAWKPGMGAALTVVEKEREVDSSASDN